MNDETELLTILSKKEYDFVLALLPKEFGKPEKVKRLSLQSTDYKWSDIDTRIRITNGKAEIIQKVGEWKNNTRTEIVIPLPSNSTVIFDMYQIFRNSMRGDEVLFPIIQLENSLFKLNDFEIKLTHQFGKKHVYSCEVFDSQIDPESLAKKFDIPIHLPEHTQDFWRKWNKTVNLSATEVSDEDLLEIIRNYL